MIYYDNGAWWGLVFRFEGTVWATTWRYVVLIIAACTVCFVWEVSFRDSLGTAGHTIFGSTMSYLLVFRANTASQRYWAGRTDLTQLFSGMRDLVMVCCVTMKGGAAQDAWRERRELGNPDLEDALDIKASMARVNCVRLALSFLVSFKLHTRICDAGYVKGEIDAETKRFVDMDRVRLRGLLTRQEFEAVDNLVPIFHEEPVMKGETHITSATIEHALERPLSRKYEVDTTPDMRQPLAVLMLMRLEITTHLNEPYGFRDRFGKEALAVCEQLGMLFELVTMVITTPIPFPYVHLCKILLLAFLLTCPLVVNPDEGFFACVILPGCAAMSLLGIDSIATELAEPFGDDLNDLDLTGLIAGFEDECLRILELCGDIRSMEAFRSYELPENALMDDDRHATEFVCLTSQVDFEGPHHVDHADGGLVLAKKPRRHSAKPKSEAPLRSSLNKGRKKDDLRASLENFEEDDPRQPLLAASGEQAFGSQKFRPMPEMDETQTVYFEEEDLEGAPRAQDNVGLSDSEDEGEEDSPAREVVGSGKGSRLKDGRKERVAKAGGAAVEEESSARLRLPDEARGSQSARGFRPMEEMGTQTIHFEEALDADLEHALDVVGLSDGEEDDGEPGQDEPESPALGKIAGMGSQQEAKAMGSYASGSVL